MFQSSLLITSTTMKMNISYLCLHKLLKHKLPLFIKKLILTPFPQPMIVCTISHGDTAFISTSIIYMHFSFILSEKDASIEGLLYLLGCSAIVVTILPVSLHVNATSRSLVHDFLHLQTFELQTLYLSPFSIILKACSLV